MVIITQLTYSITTEGNPLSTECPKVDTALTQIQTVVNSELTADNMPTVLTLASTQPARTLGTAYQPNTTRPTQVIVTVGPFSGGSVQITIGATSSPTTIIAYAVTDVVTFGVQAGWYYKIATQGGSPTITVTEQAL